MLFFAVSSLGNDRPAVYEPQTVEAGQEKAADATEKPDAQKPTDAAKAVSAKKAKKKLQQNSAAKNVTANVAAVAEIAEIPLNNKADGVYEGTGTGFAGEIRVSVEIKDQKIVAVKILSAAAETPSYMERAKGVISSILAAQNVKVDAVSGATYSSVGICSAVRDAIFKAAGVNVQNTETVAEETAEATKPATETPAEQAGKAGRFPYKDGVYFGTGTGFRGEIEVGLTIVDRTIKAVVVTKTEDDAAFFGRTKAVIDQVLKRQKTKIDAVSGATFSSKGILEAIRQALLEAKRITKGQGAVQETKPPQDDAQKPTQPTEPSQATEPSQSTDDEGERLYQDGTYEVSVSCRPDEYEDFKSYYITASIEIKGDRIVAITGLAGDGDASNEPYIRLAASGAGESAGVVEQILQKGNADGIDAVSGATCSSKAIVDACGQAFLKAGNCQ